MADEIEVVETRGRNDVEVAIPDDVRRAIGTACVCRAEFFEAYTDQPLTADALRAINSAMDTRHSDPVHLTIPWMEHAADATEWFARELFRLGEPDIGRIDGMETAASELRSAIDEARVHFGAAPRDQLGPDAEGED